MRKPRITVTNLVTFLSVVFFVEYVTCPSSSDDKVELIAKLSKVVVRNCASEVVHVYNNASVYTIRRPMDAARTSNKANWLTIRVRKSEGENFRTLVDTSGVEVEFLLLTEKIVKMVYNEEYEYTLHFDPGWNPAYFVNTVYRVSKKRGTEGEYGTLREAKVVRNDGGSSFMGTSVKLVHRKISDQVKLYYVRSREEEIAIMFPSRHFLIKVIAPKEVLITPMVVRGRPLDYKYKLEFRNRWASQAFIRSAEIHQFVTENPPDNEPQDTGTADSSITSDGRDFYDEDEWAFFQYVETHYW